MTLNKAIEYGKEHRKKYTGSKAIDKSCRNNGGCEWCKGNRMYQSKKELDRCKNEVREFV